MAIDDTTIEELQDAAAAIIKKGARDVQIGNKRVSYFSPKELAEGVQALSAEDGLGCFDTVEF